jgi:beta-amylase
VAAVEAAAHLGLRARVALHFHGGYSWEEAPEDEEEEQSEQQHEQQARLDGSGGGGSNAAPRAARRPRLRRRYHPLPAWVRAVGAHNPDIYYRDARGGTSERECLSLGVDDVPALAGRTATECYAGLARALAVELGARGLWGGGNGAAAGGVADVVVGLGPGGELRYPSHPDDGAAAAASPSLARGRWCYPCVGEFQCYDRYMLASLSAAAEERGVPPWGLSGPHDALGGYEAASPDQLGFFLSKGGSWDTEYGAFFLEWYARSLVGHACRVLDAVAGAVASAGSASPAPPPRLHARLPAVHWWHASPSRAAELTAGYCGDEPYLQALLALARRGVGAELAVVAPLSCCSPEHQAHWHHPSLGSASAADDPRGLLLQQRGTAAAVGVPSLTLVARPRGLGASAAVAAGDEASTALAELAGAAATGCEADYRGVELMLPDAVSVDAAFADHWLAGEEEQQLQLQEQEEAAAAALAAATAAAKSAAAAAAATAAATAAAASPGPVVAEDDIIAAFFLADDEHDQGVTHQARNAYGVPAELIAQHRALLEQRRRHEREAAEQEQLRRQQQQQQQQSSPAQVPARV